MVTWAMQGVFWRIRGDRKLAIIKYSASDISMFVADGQGPSILIGKAPCMSVYMHNYSVEGPLIS